MIKIEYVKLASIFVVLFGGVLAVGVANAEATNAVFQDESIDSIVESTQQRTVKLSEKLHTYQIQAEREKKMAEAIASAAAVKVNQTKLEMIRAQKLLEQLSYRQGASANINEERLVDDIVNDTQKQVVQLTVKLQGLQIKAESEQKAAESRVNDVQLKIDQLLHEKRRLQELMNQLSPSTLSSSMVKKPYPENLGYAGVGHSLMDNSYSGQQLVELGDVLFDTNKSDLKFSAMPKINMVADFLLRSPERKVLIAGHTDLKGKAHYNLELSERRAKAVFHTLLEKGVSLKQLRVSSYGDTRPKVYDKTKPGLMQNRRVEIIVLN